MPFIKLQMDHMLREIPYEPDAALPLSDLLESAGVSINKPCAGTGRCGKCRVQVTGELSAPTGQERSLLGEEALQNGIRLACMAHALGDITVAPLQEQGALAIESGVILPEISLSPLGGNGGRYGAAIDIGTTTVAAYLYDLASGRCRAKGGAPNPQAVFGADVISRIEQSLAGNRGPLSEKIVDCINTLLKRLAQETGISNREIDCVVITGNTTMLYLLTAQDPDCLSHAPFDAGRLFGERLSPAELSIDICPDGLLYLPRCISAFVGADITTAILSCGLWQADRPELLLDIGTNGEIALCHDGQLLCCSTAAGPALEGAGIYMGMTALPGAIDHVYLTGGKITYTTIGGAEAKGICGSGILDAAAVLLDAGMLDETGVILEEDHDFLNMITEKDDQPAVAIGPVILTQKDIRAIQLAKSAICAGILTLLDTAGIQPDEVASFFIAGGFGNYISIPSAVRIGLIPGPLAEKAKILGNAAAAGAIATLLQESNAGASYSLAEAAQTADLSSSPIFMDHYMDCMMFPES